MKLHIGQTEQGKAFSLPESVAGQALAIIGIRGSGKTYGATKFAEELYRNGTQIVAIDPVGVWYGLRIGADGSSKGLDITIFGGLHGDIPLQPTAGNLIADVIVSRNISAVIDVSQFESDADKARFARDFAARFFFLKKSSPSPVQVFVEEAQEFIPQNIQKGEEQMLHAWQRMVRLGRNFQIGVTMISQRPQDVNKKALNQSEWVFAFKLQGTQERKAVAEWIEGKGLSTSLGNLLPSFTQGHAYIWGPEEGISQVVAIGEKRTFSAGGRATASGVRAEPKPLAASDLDKLRDSMAKQIEEAKANDPRELKAKIAKLEKELTQKSTVVSKAAPNETVVSMAVNKAVAKRDRFWQSEIEKLKTSLKTQYAKEHKATMDFLIAQTYEGDKRWREAVSKFQFPVSELPSVETPKVDDTTTQSHVRERPVSQLSPRPAPVRVSDTQVGDIHLKSGAILMLTVLAQFESILGNVSRDQLSLLSGYNRGSTFDIYVGALVRAGLIEKPTEGYLRINQAGWDFLGGPSAIPAIQSRSELLSFLKSKMKSGVGVMLDILIEEYPNAISRDELGNRSGYNRGSTFDIYVGTLVRNKLAVKESAGFVKASDTIFLLPE